VDNVGDIVTEDLSAGTDKVNSSVTYSLLGNIENLTLTGTSVINGTGNDLANILIGNSAANQLDGGTGADALRGGAGDDTYIVDNAGDVITEGAGAGTDTVNSSVTYTLLANIENLILTGLSAINGTGNSLANIITGNAANNTLNGGTGADTLLGGLGDDIYTVDNVGDIVTEGLSAGTDRVNSSVTYTLLGNVEDLTLTGTSAINGTGNDLANILIGNAGANQLDGGTGADALRGGVGDDTYIVDNAGDVITEGGGAGTDTVNSSVTYTLLANIENLILTGLSATNGTGNSLANIITGNAANNTLNGGTGDDILDGGTGTNTLTGGAGNDIFRLTTAGHTDTITDYNVVNDTIQIENAVYTALNATGTLAAAQFVNSPSGAAVDSNSIIIYNSSTGKLLYDADGTGAVASVEIAQLTGGLALTNADIFVI
jgi:Ca2+-binding RTX toxin-like protein